MIGIVTSVALLLAAWSDSGSQEELRRVEQQVRRAGFRSIDEARHALAVARVPLVRWLAERRELLEPPRRPSLSDRDVSWEGGLLTMQQWPAMTPAQHARARAMREQYEDTVRAAELAWEEGRESDFEDLDAQASEQLHDMEWMSEHFLNELADEGDPPGICETLALIWAEGPFATLYDERRDRWNATRDALARRIIERGAAEEEVRASFRAAGIDPAVATWEGDADWYWLSRMRGATYSCAWRPGSDQEPLAPRDRVAARSLLEACADCYLRYAELRRRMAHDAPVRAWQDQSRRAPHGDLAGDILVREALLIRAARLSPEVRRALGGVVDPAEALAAGRREYAARMAGHDPLREGGLFSISVELARQRLRGGGPR